MPGATFSVPAIRSIGKRLKNKNKNQIGDTVATSTE
jgi:hypothetical protein